MPDFSWRVYVMAVFWHEMAHHVVQDAQMIINGPPPYEYAAYSLMPRQDEEGLCEYMAFTAVERGLGLPPKVIRNIPLRHMLYARTFYPHPRPKIPLLPGKSPMKPDYFRIYALCALYDHWGRGSDPVYRPCITRTASGAVGPLWNPLWEAHLRGAPVITLGAGRRRPHLGQDLRDRDMIPSFSVNRHSSILPKIMLQGVAAHSRGSSIQIDRIVRLMPQSRAP
ncbi:MAG: hypothetical protein ABC595_03150 [Candidatus Methanosuratincola petrocarbonis]